VEARPSGAGKDPAPPRFGGRIMDGNGDAAERRESRALAPPTPLWQASPAGRVVSLQAGPSPKSCC